VAQQRTDACLSRAELVDVRAQHLLHHVRRVRIALEAIAVAALPHEDPAAAADAHLGGSCWATSTRSFCCAGSTQPSMRAAKNFRRSAISSAMAAAETRTSCGSRPHDGQARMRT